ncbi:MAG: DNA polymerase/3'-5' exonuclease PolX [Balneolaceae bacterium]
MPSNQDIADQLRLVYQLMQLAGENRFRAIAFDRAAQTIEGLSDSAEDKALDGTLTSLKGIGSSIAEDIRTYAETGSMPVLESLKERVPAGLIEWLDISGLGPKNIVKIHQELGITEIDELKEACEDGRVAALSGLGEKSAEKIVKSIEWLNQFSERCHLDEADEIARSMISYLKSVGGVQLIEVAGSLRRNLETIGDIDILIGAAEGDAPSIFESFVNHERVVEILGKGETKSSVRTAGGRQVDLRIVRPDQFHAALLYFTGNKEHNVQLRQRARERKMALNEYGLFHLGQDGDTDFDQPVNTGSEEEIYDKLKLRFIPPELREGRNETELFEGENLPELVALEDIRGVLHAHSTWSDGKVTIEEMARTCLELGYEYLGISDHSRSAAYAGGLSVDEVKKQWEEIDRLNESFVKEGTEFTVFKGIESDILGDGSLDYPDDLLEGFDFVIASVHSGLDMKPEQMTDRFLRAIRHPATTIIGHPTGRLLLKRRESGLDMNRLIETAAEEHVVIEINANPMRLDLDWRYGEKAKECGLLTAVNPDAHTPEGIADIRFGVATARKAKFDKSRVINTLSVEAFGSWLRGAV